MNRIRTLGVIAVSSAVISSCGGDTLAPRMDLVRARTAWERANLDTYVFVVRRSCECLPAGIGPVEVEVVNDVVRSRTYMDGTPVSAETADVFPDVPGLFAMIEEALSQRPARVHIEYDAAYGFPKAVFVDFSTAIADEEMSYSTTLNLPGTIH